MSYKSPINVYWSEIETNFDDAVFRAVQHCGIDVNKDELIKALAYDREQYDRGYHDGLMFRLPVLTNAEKIRNMTDEDLAEYLASVANDGGGSCAPGCYDCSTHNCKEAWLNWLMEDAEGSAYSF